MNDIVSFDLHTWLKWPIWLFVNWTSIQIDQKSNNLGQNGQWHLVKLKKKTHDTFSQNGQWSFNQIGHLVKIVNFIITYLLTYPPTNLLQLFKLWGLWRMKIFFNTNFHEDKIMEQAMWAFGFGGSYVHATLLHNWYFSLSWCHHNMDKGKNTKRSFGLRHTLDCGWSLFITQ